MRELRHPRRGWILYAVALVVVTMGTSFGAREVRAGVASEATGAAQFIDGLTTVQVNGSAFIDASGVVSGSMQIQWDPGITASGPVTCLVVTGSSAVIGVDLSSGGGPEPYVVLFITDISPADTIWIDPPSSTLPTCVELPGGTPIEVTLGDYSVGPSPTATEEPPDETAEPTPEETAPEETMPDANGDGIMDTLQPSGTPLGSFADTSLVPPTTGTIVSTAGLSVSISDATDSADGVQVTVGSGAPGSQVELSTCGGFPIFVDAGSQVTITCGSVTLKVSTGTARILLGGGITIVSVPAGGAAKVSDTGGGSYAVQNQGGPGSPAVSLTVDGVTTTVAAGATTTAGTTDFVGFAQPIDASPVVNRAEAGEVIPVRWRLLDSSGKPIKNLRTAVITVTSVACPNRPKTDRIEETASRASGLKDLGRGYYQVNWKSEKAWARSCRVMHLDIGDGVFHDALFEFTR